ncbi:unnamed protein product [Orchesella dallaii]|uniref:Uncharacterized protein n=1 Tax=Orchesella dallaii TaxID=48710 RepID=A0ABP1PT17_9HEXA
MFPKALIFSQVVACLVIATLASPAKPGENGWKSNDTPAYPNCENTTCNEGEHCELVQVQCIRAPCPPLPNCVKTTGITCANVRCAGTPCVMVKTCDESENPSEVETSGKMKIFISVAVILYSIVSIVGTPVSPPGPYPEITPCSAISCAGNHICVDVPEDPTCSRGPCRLIGNCIPRPIFQTTGRPNQQRPVYQRGQCARMNCARGTTCVEVSDPYCLRYPCAEIARCVSRSYFQNNNNNNNNRPGYGK